MASKHFFIILFLFFVLSLFGQDITHSEPIYYNLFVNTKMEKAKDNVFPISFVLLIENHSNDTLFLPDFNKNIQFKGDFFSNKNIFVWELLTLENKIPDNVLIVSETFVGGRRNLIDEPKELRTEVILPHSTKYLTLYLLKSRTFFYEKGFYKLRLYYREQEKHIAETMIYIGK